MKGGRGGGVGRRGGEVECLVAYLSDCIPY